MMNQFVNTPPIYFDLTPYLRSLFMVEVDYGQSTKPELRKIAVLLVKDHAQKMW